MLFDWQQFHGSQHTAPPVVDPRRRLWLCLIAFVVSCLVIFGRVLQLEVCQGDAFRAEAAKPIQRHQSLPGLRGRILARNGAPLAYDNKVLALAVHYRYLEDPPNARWLRWTARSRLAPRERKDPERLQAEEARLLEQRRELARRLGALCGLSEEQWRRRARQVEVRVRRIADRVNRRQAAGESEPPPEPAPESFWEKLRWTLLESLRASMGPSPPERITVSEELDYHVMVEDVPLEVAAEIEANPTRYPATRIVQRTRRVYPAGPLAAHVLGHVGRLQEEELARPDIQAAYHAQDRIGRAGVERQYERLLHGRLGATLERTDRSGRLLGCERLRPPGVGRDVVLTLDPELQRAAETLLDSALARRAITARTCGPAGGAIVVMDVRNGAILAAASAPRFDPNVFAGGEAAQAAALLSDPAHPMFDRPARMALPPGSVFKTVVAAALLEALRLDPRETLLCRGYLNHPDQMRCAVYRRHGKGHGEVALPDALAQSCNVYFFHHAAQLGPERLVDWAGRFGFGGRTGVDLPGEAAGLLPTPATLPSLEGHPWRTADTQLLAIGQGSLQATPLQVARMMAAIANGGVLVTPHVASALGLPDLADGQSTADLGDPVDDLIPPPAARRIAGLTPPTLAVLREGLKRVVCDPHGTAHGTVWLDSIEVAGKTGTAENAMEGAEHAWFAGYAPADEPKWAVVVVLQHAGNAEEAAGPVAKRLILKMKGVGLL